ncbi:DNA-binding protein [Tardiphaga alba]|uniref:DNA-binding protein n=1 Tax=Tardiphaga alba TaxID=340268 RepID=A0ABX8A2K7_9BRAD|nr:type II toxin-antitoxin system VapC family toxin [Tardiphaga alba]QUS37572.1 DNA-binding protein [Tardiphaga alba]
MTLVDSNILLDVITIGQRWAAWSEHQLERAALNGPLMINDVIYAEVSARYGTFETLDALLEENGILLTPMPRAALFLAGKTFIRYRRAGGLRTGVLPDFFIGAHAAVERIPLLTRDTHRYRTYFPTVILIAPDKNEA